MNGRLGEPQGQSGPFGEQKKLLLLSEIEPRIIYSLRAIVQVNTVLQGHYNFPSCSGHSENTYEVFSLHLELLNPLNESIKLNLN